MFLTSFLVHFGRTETSKPVFHTRAKFYPATYPFPLKRKQLGQKAVLFSLFFCWQDIATILHHRHFLTRRHVHVYPSPFISFYRPLHPPLFLPPHVQIFLGLPWSFFDFVAHPAASYQTRSSIVLSTDDNVFFLSIKAPEYSKNSPTWEESVIDARKSFRKRANYFLSCHLHLDLLKYNNLYIHFLVVLFYKPVFWAIILFVLLKQFFEFF